MGRIVKGYPPELNRGDGEGRPGSRLSALLRGPKMDLSSGKVASGGRLGMGVTGAV